MKQKNILLITAFTPSVVSAVVFGRGTGISGYTLKTNTAGCGTCHTSATQNASVTLKYPALMSTSAAAQCTVMVAGSTTGVDIAASAGTLTPVLRLKSLNGELTQPSAGSRTYVFTFTAPSTPGTVTLYATGTSGGFTGSWAHTPGGTITVSSLASVEENTPRGFALEQNFPNPFNPASTIAYTLPSSEHVRLAVYDLNGRVVSALVDGVQPAGSYHVTYNAEGLASGVYLARLTAGSRSAIRKLAFLK